MTEEVKPEIIKGTQDALGKYIKKPILTEKLLKKPPFRFLYDICASAMNETGFFEGILDNPEYKFENIKDREGKIAFLQKVIATVEAANGVKLNVKPNKIVAGLEANKTNDFLQALGKALKKQLLENKNNKAPVTKTKNSSHFKESKEDQPSKKTSKTITENGVRESGDDNKKKTTKEIRPKESRAKESRSKETRGKEGSVVSPKKKLTKKKSEETIAKIDGKKLEEKKIVETKVNEIKLDEKKIIQNNLQNVSPNESKNEIVQINANEGGEMLSTDTNNVNSADDKGDQNIEKKEIIQDKDLIRSKTVKHKHRRPSIYNNTADDIEHAEHTKMNEIQSETKENKNVVNENADLSGENEMSHKIQAINKCEIAPLDLNRTTPSPTGQCNYSKNDSNQIKERALISRPRTGLRPTTARPASARPAAPRIRERNEAMVPEESAKLPAGKVNVIEDKDTSNDAEDDNLISLETTNDILLEEISVPPLLTSSPVQEGEHGHLVEQILEVKKELEDDGKAPFREEKTAGKTEIEWESTRSTESAIREIEKLRSSIQTLTRSANPLGKLFDFFQEDIDSIQRELESWKMKNSSLCIQISHEKSITEQFVEPLKIHLKEIQQSIDDQFEQISLVKASIIRNNHKIQKLLTGV